MDIQIKRGLLDVCVLAAIKDEDSYGYKIINYAEFLVKNVWKISSMSGMR